MTEPRERRALTWFLRTWTVIGLLILAVATWFVIREPLGIIGPPLALALVIVYILNPVVGGLARRGVPRVAGTALAYLVLVGAVVLGMMSLVPLLGDQVSSLADNAPEIIRNLQRLVNDQLARLGIDYRVNLDTRSVEVREAIEDYLIGGRAGARLGELLSSAGSIARGILHVALIVLLGPVLAFYLLADLPNILSGMNRIVPPRRRDEVQRVAEGIMARVGGYFRGQLLVATFVGVATATGLAVLGLPFWALIGLVTGVFNLVPLIGPFVGGAIGVVVALTAGTGFAQAIWVVVVMTVVQQIDNHIISPNVMSRTVEMHPITVMLGLLVAGSLYGILGMLVAVPVIAAAKLVILHILAKRAPWATEGMHVDSVDEPPGDPPEPATEPA